MKKFKFLMALVAIVTMITTVAFAADESMDGYGLTVPESVELADSTTTFQIKLTKGFTVDAMAFQLHYDHDIWTVTADSTLTVTAKPTYDDFVCSSATTFTDGQVLATITATAKDAAKAVTADGAFEVKEVWSEGSEDYLWCEGVYKTIAVTAAQTSTTKDFTGTAKYDNFKGNSGDWYLGVWVGEYNVTAGDAAKAIKKISVAFTGDSHAPFVVDGLNISGAGTTTFKVAIVGVPEALKDASVATATIE